MTENIKKETNDSKLSTDTIFILLFVLCGIASILLVAYLLYKPYQSSNEVVIRNIDVPAGYATDSVESIEDSLINSYLHEEPEVVVTEDIPAIEVPEITKDVPLVDDTPIFKAKPDSAKLKQTPIATTIVKKEPKKQQLITVKAYWIQVGSFSSSAQANKSVELLKERGLSSRVVLKTVNGKSVYRVRIGAYESKEEADKFAIEVKKIEGFKDSYVSESTTQKYVDL